MKPFRAKLTLRNHRLVSCRENESWSQRAAAHYIGVSVTTLNGHETLRWDARSADGFTPSALKIANFYDVDPEWLFPLAASAVTQPIIERAVDVYELVSIPAEPVRLLKGGVEARLACDAALDTLPERVARVLRMRFGLDGDGGWTLGEIGEEIGLSRERVRCIEARGLRMLRHPSRSRKLKPHT